MTLWIVEENEDVDTRPREIQATLDDLRGLTTDMANDGICSNLLAALHCSLNVSLRYAELLRTELNERVVPF